MIEIEHLQKLYHTKSRISGKITVSAVQDISLRLADGGAISLIGESGCGKTTIGRILCGLESLSDGTIKIDGRDITKLKRKERYETLQQIQLIHQDPYQALNPSHTIHRILEAPLQMMAKQKKLGKEWIQERMEELMTTVGLDPSTILYKYPHMLSGGQRQRLIIARALTVEPKVLVADESVSMIDVSLRLGILKLLRDLREKYNISLLFITHDVAAARYLGPGSELYVIYKGLIVEKGETDRVIQYPNHPYTQALLSAVPVLRGLEEPGRDRFVLEKDFQTKTTVQSGCIFADRCPFKQQICLDTRPPLSGEGHSFACHFPQQREVIAKAVSK